jgi:hypothetical protein
MKKNDHPKIEYLMPKGCLVQPYVELVVKKLGLAEIFDLPKDNKFIHSIS